MCTAITYQTRDTYFGRTLDLEYTYNETVTITPRGFPLTFRHVPTPSTRYALIGMATVADGYPLYYEAANEHGLAAAGLNFPQNAHYAPVSAKLPSVASFELIPYLLTQCRTLTEARALLSAIQLCDTAFSDAYQPSPLHWMVADHSGAVTVESTRDGLHVYENPVGVLTNNPPFPYQLTRLADFSHLSAVSPADSYSRGLGAVGLPGDWSSPSRFVRAAFVKQHAVSDEDEDSSVSQFFHILGTVEQPRGCVRADDGRYVVTAYTSCINLSRGTYYYTTYQDRTVTAVSLQQYDLDGTTLTALPLVK